jgi:hypothetical protein
MVTRLNRCVVTTEEMREARGARGNKMVPGRSDSGFIGLEIWKRLWEDIDVMSAGGYRVAGCHIELQRGSDEVGPPDSREKLSKKPDFQDISGYFRIKKGGVGSRKAAGRSKYAERGKIADQPTMNHHQKSVSNKSGQAQVPRCAALCRLVSLKEAGDAPKVVCRGVEFR